MARGMAGWGEVADALDCLRVAVREARRRDGLSLREAADRTGVAFSSITRFENGEDIYLSNAVALINWLAGCSPPSGLVSADESGILRAEGHESASGVVSP